MLIALPEVADVVVVRKPDARWGEVPVAFVVRGLDANLTESRRLLRVVARSLATRYRRRVRFVSESDLKRSSSGKIMRGDLEELLKREMIEAGVPPVTAGPRPG